MVGTPKLDHKIAAHNISFYHFNHQLFHSIKKKKNLNTFETSSLMIYKIICLTFSSRSQFGITVILVSGVLIYNHNGVTWWLGYICTNLMKLLKVQLINCATH